MTLQRNFREDAFRFLDFISSEMNKRKIILKPNWYIDHLCYRVSTDLEYFQMKEVFSALGEFLIESEVNGRLISTFKLFEPIKYKNWNITLLELPAPKKNKITPTGFEHIEIVCDISFSELEKEYFSHEIDKSGLAKNFNKEFELKFEGCAIKFHHLSLESVIRLETNKSVFSALMGSNILEILKDFSPQIVGTFPLGIYTENSDLDILLECYDLENLRNLIQDRMGYLENFEFNHIKIDDVDSLVINFIYKNVPIELFAQPIPTMKQKAFKHFQVEERILAQTNDLFKKKIFEIRNNGIKTEPAFAKALSIDKEPYLELLNYHNFSLEELCKIIPLEFQK
jgi:predicted metalloenzyme YecM